MAELSIEAIQKELELRETEDLVEIWKEHDKSQWTESAFEAIRNILTERMGEPPQYEGIEAAKEYVKEAEAHLEAEELYKALDKCNLAIKAAPHYGYAYFVKGQVMDDLEKPAEAVKQYEEALKLSPDLKEAREFLGWAMEEVEEKDRKAIRTDERIMAALAHGGVVGLPAGIILSAVVWINQHEKSTYVSYQSLQAFLWQVFGAIVQLILLLSSTFQYVARGMSIPGLQPVLNVFIAISGFFNFF